DELALVDDVARLHDDLLAVRDEVLLLLAALLVGDDEALLAADGAGHRNDAVDTGHLGGVLRATGFEELGDTGETTGDVLGLGHLARRLREQRTGGDGVALGDDDLRTGRNRVGGDDLAGLVVDLDLGIEVLLVLDDDGGDAAGGFVELALDG